MADCPESKSCLCGVGFTPWSQVVWWSKNFTLETWGDVNGARQEVRQAFDV